MISKSTVVGFLNNILSPEKYKDACFNGLQVDSGNVEIKKVGLSVDSGLSILEAAIENKCDLLICHHGIIWGGESSINGILAKKLQLLIKNNCSLYTSHLPLDGNLEIGNNAELARFFSLSDIEPFFSIDGMTIGVKAKTTKTEDIQFFISKSSDMIGKIQPTVLPFGKNQIDTVGIVSGSGSSAIAVCVEENLDLLISGEPKQESYHLAKDLSQSALFLGHYATETFGVKALGKRLETEFNIETIFINEPTGI